MPANMRRRLEAPPMGRILSPDHSSQYRSSGFLFPFQALSSEEVCGFRVALEDLEARLKAREKPLPLWQCHLHFRWAYDLAIHPRILDIVQEIIGPNILVHTSSVFRKDAGDSASIPWHQDGHYWRISPPKLVSAWIALTESTIGNGCMQVIPGSHHERLPHSSVRRGGNMLASGLTLEQNPDESTAVNVVLAPGEISLHHLNLVHGSKQNNTAESRVGFAVRYAAPEVKQELAHHAVVLARGKDACHNYDLLSEPPGDDIESGI